jgi:hemolysin activation/secretion protein
MPAAPAPSSTAPPGAETIRFVLRSLRIEGATAFSDEELRTFAAADLGQEITLARVYAIAAAITAKYREEGYFLSICIVPDQKISGGDVVLRVIEGSIGAVEAPDGLPGRARRAVDILKETHPVRTQDIEALLLRLNDLPGISLRAVLSPMPEGGEGAVRLTFAPGPARRTHGGTVGFDNLSSRYLGPNQLTGSYSASFLPLQLTTISGVVGLPFHKLKQISGSHSIALVPGLEAEVSGGLTHTHPGYTLKTFGIVSTSVTASAGLRWKAVRGRLENLTLHGLLDRRDVTSDILGAPQTRDHIRALRVGADYSLVDRWGGANAASFTVSRGLSGWGASRATDANLSRAGAGPGFTRGEWNLSRLQVLPGAWSVYGAAQGQFASGALFASEQFGYGGAAFGRAYDSSEITGDEGMSAALELRYSVPENALPPLRLQPYAFWDAGAVWSKSATAGRMSGSSAGLGTRFETPWGQTGNLGLAYALTRPASAPIYGASSTGPRLLLQIAQGF